jgi:hypothetical protein
VPVGRWSVGARSGATLATIDHAIATFWNPHATDSVALVRVDYACSIAAGREPALIRISTRGTPTSTVTPDLDNHYQRYTAPPSGVLIDLAPFSPQPTLQGPALWQHFVGGQPGSGITWWFDPEPLRVPASTGVALITKVALGAVGDATFVWDE